MSARRALTPAQAAEAHRLRATGTSARAIATTLGCSRRAVDTVLAHPAPAEAPDPPSSEAAPLLESAPMPAVPVIDLPPLPPEADPAALPLDPYEREAELRLRAACASRAAMYRRSAEREARAPTESERFAAYIRDKRRAGLARSSGLSIASVPSGRGSGWR